MPPSAAFDKAAADVKNLKSAPDMDTILKLYGLFKVVNGAKFEDAKKPKYPWEIMEKNKYAAWEKEKDTSPADAEKQYIELVDKLKSEKGFEG